MTRSFIRMTSELDSTRAEIHSLKRKIDEIEAGQGEWENVSMAKRLPYLNSLERTRSILQEKKSILLKQTAAGTPRIRFFLI